MYAKHSAIFSFFVVVVVGGRERAVTVSTWRNVSGFDCIRVERDTAPILRVRDAAGGTSVSSVPGLGVLCLSSDRSSERSHGKYFLRIVSYICPCCNVFQCL